MSVTLTISQKEMSKLKRRLNNFGTNYGAKVRKNMKIAGKEMESVAKLTVTNAGLVDTGRLRASLVPQPIDNGYGQEIKVDLGKVKSPNKGSKSGAKKGVVALVNYAVYHEPRVKFLKKGQKAGYNKFIELMR